MKEVKAIKKEYSKIINYDKINLGKEGLHSGENSLSDIDEKRSFDERSIKIKNHVPQINKLNIVKIPKKSLNPKMHKNVEMKVNFLSLNKNDCANANNTNTLSIAPNQFKRDKSLSKYRENDTRLKEKNESEVSCWDMKFPEKYHGLAQQNSKIIKHEKGTEGKVYLSYDNDKKEIIFPNGIRKLVFDDGYNIVYLNNKDLKQVFVILKKDISRRKSRVLLL